jgi:hypothetical protein
MMQRNRAVDLAGSTLTGSCHACAFFRDREEQERAAAEIRLPPGAEFDLSDLFGRGQVNSEAVRIANGLQFSGT